ncbi:hypothetical protein EXIGLDRAFT_720235 [Exidia glandulosa HHB12029]|uniref:C2H2-type domain-containing protein n=1 Tax=Exidia glandulosa HHB12029 TaxID=1314781 RepID=A0A165GHU4_EXIGL|nr:hypothetical protein EXIGLDRAFT_720235 [Exidia glandulosa HHB12029]
MAGDHKCPVCQSTFTRPQHVARHMRSHTGDRPYKCTICGDQFARSDLLSRHVNKCHAADRPQTTSRRRGSNSAAAAARTQTQQQQPTVRQCDQCAHAGLGCDLRSPCTTCATRKTLCTYPRARPSRKPGQLEPAFPGAQPNVFAPSNLSLPSLLPNDNLYANGLGDLGYNTHMFIPPLPSSDLNSNRATTLLPPLQSSLGSLDIPLHMYSSLPSAPSPVGSQMSSASGSIQLHPPPGTSQNGTLWPNGSATGLPSDLQSLHAPRSTSDLLGGYESYDSRPSTGSLPSPRSLIDMSQPPVDLYGYRRGHSHSQSDSGTHSDFSTSSSPALGSMRGGSFSSQGSGPQAMLNLSNDVFAHLPPDDQQQLSRLDPQAQAYMLSNNMQLPRGDGQFSNAFGLLSLEELRNQANGQFFPQQPASGSEGVANNDLGIWNRHGSQRDSAAPAGNDSTATDKARAASDQNAQQNAASAAPPALSPGTEARQIKEFWKAFMVDPYATGQTPDAETPGALKTPHAGARPGYIRSLSLSKSASLPPLRRSSGSNANVHDRHAYDDSTPHASMAQQLGHAHNNAAPPKSLVNPADLRSYEEAIRSRPPPVLKFDPRAKQSGEFARPFHPMNDFRLRGGGATSDDGGAVSDPQPMRRGSGSAPQAGTSSAAIAHYSADEGSRPSFKRLASQTLVPEQGAKRAMHTRLGDIDAADSPGASSASVTDGDGDDEKDSVRDPDDSDDDEPRGRTSQRVGASVQDIRDGNFITSRRTIPATNA